MLSLDPQTTYSTIAESRFDFSEGSLEEQQASALGNLAQEGAFIQFLVADSNITPVDFYSRVKLHTDATRRSTVIGVVPSTVDEMAPISEDNGSSKADKPLEVRIWLGHFGCVSESGMFIKRSNPSPSLDQVNSSKTAELFPPIDTKVDLPFSYIYRYHGNDPILSPKTRKTKEQKEITDTSLDSPAS